jgi:hypothetical protein
MKYIILLLLLLLLLPSLSLAQFSGFRIFPSAGFAYYLGDLGGGLKKSSSTGLDFDPSTTRYNFKLSAEYVSPFRLGIGAEFAYVKLFGSDAYSQDIQRKNRNLNFRADIFVSSVLFSYYIPLKKVNKSNFNGSPVYFRLFTGTSFIYFNSKGFQKGQWVDLRPLHTEGQGLPGGPKQYNQYTIAIPAGLGFQFPFEDYWSVGFDFVFYKTFTDYLDDVSGKYYDNQVLLNSYGQLSSIFADPNKSNIPKPAGLARGGNSFDNFTTFNITLTYLIPLDYKSSALINSSKQKLKK